MGFNVAAGWRNGYASFVRSGDPGVGKKSLSSGPGDCVDRRKGASYDFCFSWRYAALSIPPTALTVLMSSS